MSLLLLLFGLILFSEYNHDPSCGTTVHDGLVDVNRKSSVAWSGDEIAVGYNLSLDYICLSFGNLAPLRMLNPL